MNVGLLSGVVVESIERMKEQIQWSPSPEIKSGVVGDYPSGERVVIAPNDAGAGFVAVVEAGDMYLSTSDFRACPMLAAIYAHAQKAINAGRG